MIASRFKWMCAQLRGSDLRTQLIRGGVASLFMKAAQLTLSFLVVVVWVRVLGPESYGTYSFALAIIILSAIPAQVGIPQLIVRETARTQAESNWALMRGLWRWGNLAVAFFSFLSFCAVMLALHFLEFAESSQQISTLIIGVVLIPLIALANVRDACLRGLRRVVLGQFTDSILRPILLLVVIGVWVVIGDSNATLSASRAMTLHVITVGIAFVFGIWLLRKYQPTELAPHLKPQYDFRKWFKAVIPLGLIGGIQVVNNQIDIVMVGIYRPEEEVGLYKAVSQLAILVLFAFQAFNQVLQPFFARLYASGDNRKINSLLNKALLAILAFSLPIIAIYAFFGKFILATFFGDYFESGSLVLVILSIGLVFKSFYGISATSLNMTGSESLVFIIGAVSVVMNIFLNFLLIPLYGIEGAASSSAITFFTLGALGFGIARNKFSNKTTRII